MQLAHAFTIDEHYDRVHASDRTSRFGVYLARLAGAFRIDDDPRCPLIADPVRFAATAWEISRPPVMDPPYVTAHSRVLDTASHQDDDGRTAIGIHLAVSTEMNEQSCLDWCWRGWSTDGPHGHHTAPHDNTYPVALTQLKLRIPLEASTLPQPRYREDRKSVV